MNEIKVKDVMTNLVVTCRRSDTIQQAARTLLNNRISGAPVVEQGRLVGVISEADLVAAYSAPTRALSRSVAPAPLMFLVRGSQPPEAHRKVGDVMTTHVVGVSPEATVWHAAALIDRHGVRRLPVVDQEGYVVGVIARADLVRAMARDDEAVAVAVARAVQVLGEENFSDLYVEAADGIVTVAGSVDRRSTAQLALNIASQVPGVLEVVDELTWKWDDADAKPVRTPASPSEIGRDPWAVGPLVKEGAS